MTHNEKRSSVWKEFLATSISGIMYGTTNTFVGHPLDTIKTKMQATEGMMNKSLGSSIMETYSKDGFVGFYRGCIPNFWGSIIFRSI